MGQPWPLFCLFSVFSNKQCNFYNKSMWKMSIQFMDSSPRTFKHESSPITTRPGLLKKHKIQDFQIVLWSWKRCLLTFLNPYKKKSAIFVIKALGACLLSTSLLVDDSPKLLETNFYLKSPSSSFELSKARFVYPSKKVHQTISK